MLSASKDNARLYPVTDIAPVTFPVPETGGAKTTSLTLQTDTYPGTATLQIRVVGPDLYTPASPLTLSIRKTNQAAASVLPNNTLLLSLPGGTPQTLSFFACASVLPGDSAEWRNLFLECQVLASNTILDYLLIPVRVVRAPSALPLRFRVLTDDRKLQAETPGFEWGSYRWRDEASTNTQVLVPTNWDVDLSGIPPNSWQAGIARGADLALARLSRDGHAIYPIVQSGEYFTGQERYYAPSGEGREELFPLTGSLTYTLTARPARQKPLFVGIFQADTTGYFDARVRYRYQASGAFDPANFGPQFLLNRQAQTVTLNQTIAMTDLFAGFIPNNRTEWRLQLPVYPVWQVQHAYLDSPEQACPISSFVRETGTLTVTLPANSQGRRLYLSYQPAIVIRYEGEPAPANPADPQAAQPGEVLLSDTNLNPAFSGISQGTLYLLHRTPRVQQLLLSVDKPRIALPASRASVVDLVAFGPVSYEQDFALLLATALGATPQERIAGASLQIVPGDGFLGLVNATDPQSMPVTMRTGGDGVSSFVYTPPSTYGYYLALSSVSNATVALPLAVPLSQLWNAQDGWLLRTYTVGNDAPTLGKVGANLGAGELPWIASGLPGTTTYQTNGYRFLWESGGQPVVPVNALDHTGQSAFLNNAVNPAFDGNAVSLLYAANLPAASNIGAYFLGFTGVCLVQVQDLDTGILSNSILLQLAPSQEVIDTAAVAGYLYLNRSTPAQAGRLNANRLGGGPLPSVPFYTPLVS